MYPSVLYMINVFDKHYQSFDNVHENHIVHGITYRRSRARSVLTAFDDVPLRATRALSP